MGGRMIKEWALSESDSNAVDFLKTADIQLYRVSTGVIHRWSFDCIIFTTSQEEEFIVKLRFGNNIIPMTEEMKVVYNLRKNHYKINIGDE